MKVLHVIPSLSQVHGGPTRALATIEQALLARGIDVGSATTDDDGPGRRLSKPHGVAIRENGAVHWYFRKVADFYKPAPGFVPWIWREVGNFDIVHVHALFSFTSVAAGFAARRRGVPYIVRPLGTLGTYGMRHRRPWAKALSLRVIESRLLRDAAAVHFTSEKEAQEARALGLDLREAVIPLGVDLPHSVPARARRSAHDQHFTLLFLSRLDPKKNLEALLDAIAGLETAPAVRLLVAGDGDAKYVARLQARCRELRIQGKIDWLGHLTGGEKSAAFAAADLFVLPSFSENFGIAVAEALAAGVPCMVGKGVAISDQIVRRGAGVAVAPSSCEIAHALRHLLERPEELESMATNAVRLARDAFGKEAMGARLESLYRDCIERTRRVDSQ